jgi:hypothetical protein
MPQDASYTGWEADATGQQMFAPAVFIEAKFGCEAELAKANERIVS